MCAADPAGWVGDGWVGGSGGRGEDFRERILQAGRIVRRTLEGSRGPAEGRVMGVRER